MREHASSRDARSPREGLIREDAPHLVGIILYITSFTTMTFTKDHLPQILWHFCYISDLVCCGSLSLACKSLRESVEVTPAQVSPTDLGQHEPMLCIGWYPECVVDHSHVHVTQGCFLLFQTRQGGLGNRVRMKGVSRDLLSCKGRPALPRPLKGFIALQGQAGPTPPSQGIHCLARACRPYPALSRTERCPAAPPAVLKNNGYPIRTCNPLLKQLRRDRSRRLKNGVRRLQPTLRNRSSAPATNGKCGTS
mmetsp:Transcript_29752/g.95691  ORF Transcript_29752/g.95691 Transcript_29752/m.95691 type:complete len:251 (+) Transcript_29752:168-920(+)